MKKKIILLPLVGLLIYVVLTGASGGPTGSSSFVNGTGSAGVTGCSCHSGSSSSNVAVTIELLSGGTPVSTYVGGNVYTVRLTGVNNTSSNLPKYGFQVSSVFNSGAGTGGASQAGTFSSAPSGTRIASFGGLSIYEQTTQTSPSSGSGSGGGATTYQTSITWTAPAAGSGSVKLFGVLNAVDNNGGASFPDQWNNASLVIPESVGTIGGGVGSICVGATTTYTCTPTGGTWSSGNTSVATVGTSGVVTGAGPGTAVISYNAGASGIATRTVTVLSTPTSITSSTSSFALCQNSNITLTGAPTGGTWTSTGGGFAAVNSTSGLVTGVSGGISTISYTLSSGCSMAQAVTVNSLPSAGTINPTPATGCVGAPATMTNPVSGGTWSVSSGGGFATIGSATGIVTGTAAGPVIVSYTVTSSAGCIFFTSRTITINASPAATTGTANVCVGGTTTLSNSTPGGTWSAFTGTGSVSLTPSGTTTTVTGLTAGMASVSYTVSGCAAATVVTVDALASPGTISGGPNVCLGSTTTLTNTAGGGGTWTSSASGIASVAGSGTTATVTGVSLGSAVITYTIGSGACSSSTTKTINVQPVPGAITGTQEACVGASSTLGATPSGGTWSSPSGDVAVGGTSGTVTGINAGTATISYTISGCSSTAVFTVNAAPTVATISGGMNPCVGTTVPYTNATPGGTWSTTGGTGAISLAATGTSVAVTGFSAGTANLTYSVTNGSGCTSFATRLVTVNTTPSAITGSLEVCVGSTTVLTGSGGTGTWSSGTTSVAGVTSPGLTSNVSGLSAGTSTITFTLGSTGCSTTSEVTVNPVPSAITGSTSVCIGESTPLSSSSGGGTWSSSNTAQATVDITGLVTGAGIVTSVPTITYTLPTTCRTTRTITVNANPTIAGANGTCVGSSVTLTGSPSGGTWSTTSPEATVSGTGVVTGASLGIATITYTLSTGCIAIKTMTVVAGPTDFSGTPVCAGATLTLSSTPNGGTWTSSNPGIAAVGATSGIVTGGSAGIANITYTVGGCSLIRPQTVNATPVAIAGGATVCEGASITLNDATAGGTWTSVSGTGSVSLVPSGSSVIVIGVTAGSVTISYALPSGCGVAKSLGVNASPSVIMGTTTACVGLTTTLSNTVMGGTWSSSNTTRATVGSTSGIVTGVSSGTANITYTLPGGCYAVTTVTVNPSAPIGGLSSLCTGTSTTLTNSIAGGIWTSSNPGVASVGATSGAVNALAPGTTTISYTLPTTCAATITLTVISAPSPIAGNLRACLGFTTALSSPGGGTWSSSNPIVAIVGSSSGIVTGIGLGTASITYSLGSGCSTASMVTVSPNPAAVVGGSSVCEGSCLTFTDATPGGTWSTIGTTASISGGGVACGTGAGLAIISYTLPTGCGAAKTITVNGLPNPITGTFEVCAGSATSLNSLTPGGSWASSNPTVATVGSGTGVVNGLSAGTSTIAYTVGGCSRMVQVTVNALPGTITGASVACVGQTNGYSIATPGGTWSITPLVVATVNATSGDVTGVAAGSATLVYTSAQGCTSLKNIAVNVPPAVAAITGTTLVCEHVTTALADATGGGSWSSASSATATVNSSGVVSGVAAGTTDITYTVTVSGCSSYVTTVVTVDPAPAAITGTLGMCAGAGTTLSDITPGGAWSSSATGIADVGSGTGVVSGFVAGTSVISYTISNGCSAWATVTVYPIPSAGTITVPSVICMSTPATLSSSVAGGVWSTTAVSGSATIGSSSGVVTGTSAGTADVTYTYTSGAGCTNNTVTTITVNPLPTVAIITGPTSVCPGTTITLSNATPGGVWSSSAVWTTIGSSTGVVTGVTAGTETVTYSVTNSCGTATSMYFVTVNPMPYVGTTSGPTSVCPGQTITLSNTVSGGAWSSSSTVATVSGTGVVTGVTGGVANISYSVTNSCGTAHAIHTVNVTPLPSVGAITGIDSVCVGDTIYMSNSVSGGIWGNATGRAAVSSTGVVIGMVGGIDTVKYTVINACGSSAIATRVVKVRDYGVCHVGVSPAPEIAGDVKVYPNPSAGIFTVEISALHGQPTISVIDVLGKVVDTKVANTEKTTFNLNNLAAGTYMVRVSMDGNTYRQAIVIH